MTSCHGICYIATSPSGKSYVGQTTGRLSARWSNHASCARIGRKSKLYSALRKYPADQWTVVVASRARTQEQLDAQEQFLIKMFGDYNLMPGGLGGKHSEETRAKMSASHKGKKRSADSVAKSAAARRGKKLSEATKKKISASRKALPFTPWSDERRARHERKYRK